MKNKLLYIWKKISENGISDDLDNAEKKRIRVLNRIIFINALLAFTFLIIGKFHRPSVKAVFNTGIK